MKLEKKYWVIIGVVVVIILVWYFLRKKKAESGYGKEPDCLPGCQCVGGTVNCVFGESNWKPDVRSTEDELRTLKGISLANISTFGTPLT